MLGVRSTKNLADRIDIDYVDGPEPLRRSLWMGTGALVVLVLLSFAVFAVRGGEWIFSKGPITVAHAMFGNECGQCHTRGRLVGEAKCLVCHEGTSHRSNLMFEGRSGAPSCSWCHREHGGTSRLVDLPDFVCIQCHADLKTSDGRRTFEARVSRFVTDHPEFAVFRKRLTDGSQIKFNHAIHMKSGLRGIFRFLDLLKEKVAAATRNELVCTDCHRLDPSGRFMSPIRYVSHCAACHELQYDGRFKKPGTREADVAPHDQPLAIHWYLLGRFADYARRHPDQAIVEPTQGAPDEPSPSPEPSPGASPGASPEPSPPPPPPPGAQEWVLAEVESTESSKLMSRDCKYCHTVEESPPSEGVKVPYAMRLKTVPSRIPARWFLHARFNHDAHRLIDCSVCHPTARASKATSDVNLPGIRICRECHRTQRGARPQCVVCHAYHDRSTSGIPKGSLKLEDLKARKPMR